MVNLINANIKCRKCSYNTFGIRVAALTDAVLPGKLKLIVEKIGKLSGKARFNGISQRCAIIPRTLIHNNLFKNLNNVSKY